MYKFLILIIVFCSLAFPEDKGKKRDKVSFGGMAEIGMDVQTTGLLGGNAEDVWGNSAVNDRKIRRIGVVEAEFKILPADSVELEFDLEFDHRFTDVSLEKLFVRYNFENSNARLGYMKKMFTLEEIKNARERLFLKKSMMHEVLEEYFLLERDLTAQYRYYFPYYTLIGGYSADGSNAHAITLTALSKEINRMKFTAAAMFQNYREWGTSRERANAFFGNIGMFFDGGVTDFEIEGVLGVNPQEQVAIGENYQLEYSNNGGINFWGFRFQESFPVDLNRKVLNRIIPFYEITYVNTSANIKNAYWQARPAINFCFTPKNRLQLRTFLDFVLTANNQESKYPQIVSERVVGEVFVMW